MHSSTRSRRLLLILLQRLPLVWGWLIVSPLAHAASITGLVSDKDGAALAVDAVLYATPVADTAAAKPVREVRVDQVNKEFVPHITVVQTGTAVNFPNKDSIRHHVYSFSPAKIFELKLYSGILASPVLFDKSGPVVMGCNIHDWMLGYIYVVDTPYFSKTVNGRARIEGLPAGDYELNIWHPQLRAAAQTQRVKLSADDAITIKFSLDLVPRPPDAGLNPSRKQGAP